MWALFSCSLAFRVAFHCCWCVAWARTEDGVSDISLSWMTRNVKTVSSLCLLPYYDTYMLFLFSRPYEMTTDENVKSRRSSEPKCLPLCHFILLRRNWGNVLVPSRHALSHTDSAIKWKTLKPMKSMQNQCGCQYLGESWADSVFIRITCKQWR